MTVVSSVLPDLDNKRTAGATGRQRMLTPPKHPSFFLTITGRPGTRFHHKYNGGPCLLRVFILTITDRPGHQRFVFFFCCAIFLILTFVPIVTCPIVTRTLFFVKRNTFFRCAYDYSFINKLDYFKITIPQTKLKSIKKKVLLFYLLNLLIFQCLQS